MSSRQKSFFEQGNRAHKSFHPSYSQAFRSANDATGAAPPSKPAMAIVATAKARNKLKAFHFVEGRPSSQQSSVATKENASVPVESTGTRTLVGQTPVKSLSQGETHDKRLPPSTPIPRLPLADLLGNSERRVATSNVTPEEQVTWVHAQTPRGSQPANTPARKRKRARSSSPAPSAQERRELDADRGVHIPTMLQTPQADLAADLWQRYVCGKDAPSAITSASYAHLIRETSPKTPATAGSVGGLRRWASCGIEWPTSNASSKRRRVVVPIDDRPGLDVEPTEHAPKTSKVGHLLERIKETLIKPPSQVPDGPSSSAPSPERPDLDIKQAPQPSPVHRLTPVQELGEISSYTAVGNRTSSSSDYGDDDLDMALLESAEDATMETTSRNPQIAMFCSQPEDYPRSTKHQDDRDLPLADEDEFGDDDDELLAFNLDAVAAKYDAQLKATEKECTQKKVEVHVLLEDEFGDNDIDDEQFVAVEAAATQAYQASGKASEPEKTYIQRYIITAIHQGHYVDEHGRQMVQKTLVVKQPRTELTRTIMLRQAWYDTPATVDSYVHVTGAFDKSGLCTIDNENHILVLHPDHLISATVVADSFGCVRRAVLQDRVKATGEANAPMMYGHILHELFQEAMKTNNWTNQGFQRYMDATLPRHFETMVEIGIDLNQVHEYLKSKIPEMRAWAELFVTAEPRKDAVIKGRNGKQAIMSINKLLDVEEHIWSPKFGLKGNVDATVQATIKDGSSSRRLTLPFELKTGKRVSENHVAQTALYTLLTSDRYDVGITEGILYYLEDSHIMRVQAIRNELIHLIMKRNELACYVRERLKLPPMLQESRQRLCNHCYAQTTCFLYHKLAEDGTSDTIANKGKFEQLVKYLRPVDQDFFQKWDQLLTKEESEMKKFTRELWTMLSKERERRGRCFGNVIIEPGTATERQGASKINRFQYTFLKHLPGTGFSFTESQITVGEPIVVSDEQGHYALANGYVTHVQKKRITVAVDRRLHNARTRMPGFDSKSNQDFIGVIEATSSPDFHAQPVLYRLDKDEFSNGMATARSNMLRIMDDTVFKAADLRALIVQNRAPRFESPSTAVTLQNREWHGGLNTDQKAAIEKVMAAKDYALVLGMPGTGKTTTIAQIIRALVAQNKSVLLTSYTHTAVDNILLKIRDAGFDVLRLGVLAKVHPSVQEFAILAGQQKNSLEEVQDAWFKPAVVATTCLGVNHPIFSKRTFDYCIVDEASQITMPVCLGPIRMARTFILVGDHFQLPPLVQNKEAQEGGLDISLFRSLSEKQPDAVVNLEHQYRMCEDIMHLPNKLIYDGRLKCGTSSVARQALELPQVEAAMRLHHFSFTQRTSSGPRQPCPGPSLACSISRALDPTSKVLFFNTDSLLPLSRETQSGPRITNPLEAQLTAQFVLSFLTAGIEPGDVGVITFYRSQLAELRQLLRHQPALELHTADRFQGRDKAVVVASFVRNNEDLNVGELLRDWRRVNVAITRAKTKLIMLGSKRTLLNGGPVLKGLVEICEQKGWMHDLREGEHCFPELATQISGVTQGASPAKRAAPGVRKAAEQDASKKRKALAEIDVGKLNERIPEKKGRIGERSFVGRKSVLGDIVRELIG